MESEATGAERRDFIRDMIAADVRAGKHGGRVCTRFPPEPNGYLHIGHAKSICLNFGVAQELGGVCHLRMDDTNPAKEDVEYVEAIQRDVRWLGFDWADRMFYASDYYGRLYDLAEHLIRLGRAYVCDLDEEAMAAYRGTAFEAGRNSPYRDRGVDENLDLFRRMRAGEFAEGQRTLRAKIDMTSPNMKMRDPPLYRIKKQHHYRTGDTWPIYPLYDYAHCLSDSFEGITHSLCTMEFESARELYDWVVAATEVPHVPRQTEFARLNLSYTVMSKRKLLALVQGGHVRGWDDPRMPTLAGLRRRGVTPEAIREFCARVGVARNLSVADLALFEHTIRDDLSPRAPRVLAVLHPLELEIEGYGGEGGGETLDAPLWPHDVPREGTRPLPFSAKLYIDRDDFAEEPPPDWKRLAPGRSVRLRHAYIVTCKQVIKDAGGQVVRLVCTYDPATRGGVALPGQKVDGTIQWVSEAHALDAEVRLYDRLFVSEDPEAAGDFREDLNPTSLAVVRAKVEPSLASASHGDRFQFERLGYFSVDPESSAGAPVFNRTVSLKDSWSRKTQGAKPAAPRATQKPRAPEATRPRELSPEVETLRAAHGLTADEAHTIHTDPALAALFESARGAGAPAKALASLLVNDVRGELRTRKLTAPAFAGSDLAELLALVADGTLSSKLAKDVLGKMFDGAGAPRALAQGLSQITDTAALDEIVLDVLARNEDAVNRFRSGNANVLGALVGLTMKASGGKANPKLVTQLLKKHLA